MKNIHPADELAMIRSDLRRLKEREDYLRKGFLSLRLPTRGDEAVATVKIVKERKLCTDRLPQHVLENPDLWEMKVTRHVYVDKLRDYPNRIPAFIAGETNVDVLEHF